MNRFMKTILVGSLLLIICGILVGPVSAATTQVHLVKYANDGTTILAERTVDYHWMMENLLVMGDGETHYYHQGPVFIDDPDEATEQALRWNPGEDINVQEKDYGAAMGTNVKDLCDLVGGMEPGDTMVFKASDGWNMDFTYENVYGYSAREGPIVLAWYTDFDFDPATPGKYPDTGYADGMRMIWFADAGVNPWGIHAFGVWDWHEAAASEYWYYYYSAGEMYPTTTGLSGKYISEIKIYSNEPAGPVAGFSAVPLSGVAPVMVYFTDLSSGSDLSYAWDFQNDGMVDSTDRNPSFTYNTVGVYTVNLTVTNPQGSDNEVKTDYISVLDPAQVPPIAGFTATPTMGKPPLTVQFTDTSIGAQTRSWDFGDGTTSTDQNPQHTYAAEGFYTVSLTVTNLAGSDDRGKSNYITVRSLLWGPYLTGTTTTGTMVNVKTYETSTVIVEYATDEYYQANGGYDRSATDGLNTLLHHIALSGLEADTHYHYRVLYDGEATGDLHFRTFPERGPFTFVMYSDTQDQLPTFSQLERHKLVADRIAEEENVAFVLNSGDLVNDASDLVNWDRYFAAGSTMMAGLPVYPARGNHDDNAPNYFAAYGVPDYYSFDYGDGHFVVLDSNDWAWPNFPTQSTWLAADLQATEKPFRFVSFHYPPYSSDAKHFGGWENIRTEWEDEFIANGVLAVFNGHVHAYERFLANDVNYFVSGTGGGPAYSLAIPPAEGSQNSLENALAYIRVTVDPAGRTATADVIRVADVSSDLKTITTLYPPGTVFETVVMHLAEPSAADLEVSKAWIEYKKKPEKDALSIKADFVLPEDQSVDLMGDPVTIEVDGFLVEIPVGAFKEKKGVYKYESPSKTEPVIRVKIDLPKGTLDVDIEKADFSAFTYDDGIDVGLRIGEVKGTQNLQMFSQRYTFP